jgi:hypothetical protein
MHQNDKLTKKIFSELDSDSDGILTIHDIIEHPQVKHLNLRKAISIISSKNAILFWVGFCSKTYTIYCIFMI